MSEPTTTERPVERDQSTGVSAAIHEAPAHVAEIAGEAGEQARNLVDDARSQLRQQADDQASRAAEGLRRAAIDLETMASASPRPESPVAEAARQLARVGDRAGERLEARGLDGVLNDVSVFARRHPGAFLGIAFGVGVAAGRLLRSDVEHRRDGGGETTAPGGGDIDLRADAGGALTPQGDLAAMTGGGIVGVGGAAPLDTPLPGGGAV